MAENINISFAPNKSASESQRIADLEQYVSTLTERTKFAFASIIEEYNDTSADDEQTVNMIYQTASESGSDVGQFTDTGKNCEIFNDYSENIAQSHFSHAEGSKTSATAPYAHAEGHATTASAPSAHAEGDESKATNSYAHAEGRNTQATGYASHAEGEDTVASGWLSHAEGKNTVADGMYSHAEGGNCKAIGDNSHAGGMYSEALSEYSFAHGYGVKSSWTNGIALGRRNKTQNTLFVIGNGGWQEGSESDALTLDENGMLWIEGSFEASAKHGGLGIAIHGVARFGDNWTTDGVDVLLAVGNGYDSERKSDALSLDQSGNLHIAGKLTADGGIEGGSVYILPKATKDTLGGVMIGDNVSVTADGTISVDLSAYLKSTDISEWAKQSEKPTYTANEIGLGNVNNTADADKPISTATQAALDGKADTGHTHTVSDITDMPAYLTEETDPTVPAWAKAESKPVYTAEEVGAVTPYELDSKDYLKATEISGQTIDLNDITMNTASDKGKSRRYFCTSLSAQNIENRPISANEPFELSVDNIRNINTEHFNTIQRYTSVARKRTYTRWCNDGAWSAWKCDTDVVVYGSVTEDSPKTFAYATYGEGFGVVEIEAYYDNATNPVRNHKVFALSPTASIERVMLTISNGSSESVTLANGTITMSMTGTTALSFVIRYTNSR